MTVIAMFGQSLCRGNAGAVPADASLGQSFASCQYLHDVDGHTASTGWGDLVQLGTTDAWGPELSMGRKLVSLGVPDPRIIKVAVGGSQLANEWLPTADGGPGAWVTRLKAAIDLGAMGVDCFVFAQGEGDAGVEANANAWQGRAENLIAELRAHVSSTTTPVILMPVRSLYFGAFTSTVRAGAEAIASADANVHIYDPDHLDVHDAVHQSATGLDANGDGWANLYVTAVAPQLIRRVTP